MTKALYLDDSYLTECDALIQEVKDGKYIRLNQTIFYPRGGGQPWDTGTILRENEKFSVVYVGKFAGDISHEVDQAGLAVGDQVHCVLNWDQRYKLMRSHTAAHVFSSLLCSGTGALVTGNQLDVDKVRFDFSLETFQREILHKYIAKANEYFARDIPVTWYELPREEALRIPGVIKMAEALPPNVPYLRIVEVEGLDKQADGGTHVKNLKEVGSIELIRAQNKGKFNRRAYFRLIDP
jgi:misacylated tRNA(Ala) deacylase